ncbi:MAG: hypothetical protein AB7U20_15040 [Planctomycetaceae bacterium]
MHVARTLAAIVVAATAQSANAVDPDRSSPQATVESLKAATLSEDLAAIAECVTPDSDQFQAVQVLGHVLSFKRKLEQGNVAHRLAAGRIDQFLADQGIGQQELVSAAMTAADRPQSSALLMLALAIQNVEHKPRFAAAAVKQLESVCAELEIPFQLVRRHQSKHWATSDVVDVVVIENLANVKLQSPESTETVSYTFEKLGDHWLLQRPAPLPPAIRPIVNDTEGIHREPKPSEIVVDRSSTQFPESVYLLARRAWMMEDMQAFAECLTADSLDVQAMMTLMFVDTALRRNDLPNDLRIRLEQALESAGVGVDAVGGIIRTSATQVVESRGESNIAQSAARDAMTNLVVSINHRPRFCSAAQTALQTMHHGEQLFEMFHLRHTIQKLGNELDNVVIDGPSAVGTAKLANGRGQDLRFIQTDNGWRISLPFPIPSGELPDLPQSTD